MTEQIDLTDDGNEASSYVSKDEGSRKRVVALAEGLNERLRVADALAPRKRVRTAVDGVELPAPTPANGEMLQARSASAAAASKHGTPQAVAAPLAAVTPSAAAAQPINSLLGQLHAERLSRMSEDHKAALRSPCKPLTGKPGDSVETPSVQPSTSTRQPRTSTQPTISKSARDLSVLSYNLWFNEDVALIERMRAVGDLIEREGFPDLLLFQEVTHNIVLIFRQSNWFRRYHCSPVPEDKTYFTLLLARRDTVTLPAMQPWMEKEYANTCMGRTILYTRTSVGGRPLVVGTTHLESPVGPGPQQMVTQRREQLEVAMRELEAAAGAWGDVLLAGDLNWSDIRDGPMRLPPRWCDAWLTLVPDRAGLTWDPVSNPMLTSRWKGSRLDRVLCRMSAPGTSAGAGTITLEGPTASGGGWQLGSIKLVGTQALPGLTHEYKGKRLPVLPSDHFGLLVKLLPTGTATEAAGPVMGHVLGSVAAAAAAPPSTSGALPAAPAINGLAEVGSSERGVGTANVVTTAPSAAAATESSNHVAGPEAAPGVKPLRRLPDTGAASAATATAEDATAAVALEARDREEAVPALRALRRLPRRGAAAAGDGGKAPSAPSGPAAAKPSGKAPASEANGRNGAGPLGAGDGGGAAAGATAAAAAAAARARGSAQGAQPAATVDLSVEDDDDDVVIVL